jgi:hypothetical protein
VAARSEGRQRDEESAPKGSRPLKGVGRSQAAPRSPLKALQTERFCAALILILITGNVIDNVRLISSREKPHKYW